jgi:hypothetical protein
MILDYPHQVDFGDNKSLRRFRRWLSFKKANYITTIQYIKDTNKYFKNPENRIVGCDYIEAKRNIEMVNHWHWAITEILNHSKKYGTNNQTNNR